MNRRNEMGSRLNPNVFPREVSGKMSVTPTIRKVDNGKQLLNGIGRSSFLPEAEKTADEDDHEDDNGIGRIMKEE
jgi:hypothetical protein